MDHPPRNIRALKEERTLELQWSDGTNDRLPFRFVRGRCPCASCVDEVTGQRVVDVTHVAEDVSPTEMGFSGNYALKFMWSDGHHTGLYTWAYLQQLCREHRHVTT